MEKQRPRYEDIVAKPLKDRGCTVWITERKELENYIHPDVIRAVSQGYSGKCETFEDVPELFAQAVHESSESAIPWPQVVQDMDKHQKKVSAAKRRLNFELAAKMTPDLLSVIDPRNEVRGWLRQIGAALNWRRRCLECGGRIDSHGM
jgi:putative ATP-dependent endonuclease of the OLD family